MTCPEIEPDLKCKFLVMGDMQYEPTPLTGDGLNARRDPRQWMIRDSINHAVAQHPDIFFAATTGDYADPRVNEPNSQLAYDELRPFLQSAGVPWYSPVGNHDVRDGLTSGAGDNAPFYTNTNVFETNLTTVAGKTFVETAYGHGVETCPVTGMIFDIFVLNSLEEAPAGVNGQFKMSQVQEAWLQNELNALTAANRRVVVFTHAAFITNATRGGNDFEQIHNGGEVASSATLSGQAKTVTDMLSTWQANSAGGLVIGVFAGHTHIEGHSLTSGVSDTPQERINHFTLDEFDEVVATARASGDYDGTNPLVTSNLNFLSSAAVCWNETKKRLEIIGYGQQESYIVDMSDRIN